METKEIKETSWLKTILKPLTICCFFFLFAYLMFKVVITPTIVSGPSMVPNLVNGERVWAINSNILNIDRGSVIVFDAYEVDPSVGSSKLYVKRVIGLPGDKVTASQGTIYVNDRPIDQRFIPEKQQKATGKWNFKSLSQKYMWPHSASTVVPKDQYFVLGDNRSVSNDSRYFGFVPKNKVKGVVKVFFWTKDTSNQRRYYINKQAKEFWEGEVKNDH